MAARWDAAAGQLLIGAAVSFPGLAAPAASRGLAAEAREPRTRRVALQRRAQDAGADDWAPQLARLFGARLQRTSPDSALVLAPAPQLGRVLQWLAQRPAAHWVAPAPRLRLHNAQASSITQVRGAGAGQLPLPSCIAAAAFAVAAALWLLLVFKAVAACCATASRCYCCCLLLPQPTANGPRMPANAVLRVACPPCSRRGRSRATAPCWMRSCTRCGPPASRGAARSSAAATAGWVSPAAPAIYIFGPFCACCLLPAGLPRCAAWGLPFPRLPRHHSHSPCPAACLPPCLPLPQTCTTVFLWIPTWRCACRWWTAGAPLTRPTTARFGGCGCVGGGAQGRQQGWAAACPGAPCFWLTAVCCIVNMAASWFWPPPLPAPQLLPGVRRHRGRQRARHARQRHAGGPALRRLPGRPPRRRLRGHGP